MHDNHRLFRLSIKALFADPDGAADSHDSKRTGIHQFVCGTVSDLQDSCDVIDGVCFRRGGNILFIHFSKKNEEGIFMRKRTALFFAIYLCAAFPITACSSTEQESVETEEG